MPFPSDVWGFRGQSWQEEAFFGAEGHAEPYQVHRYEIATGKVHPVWKVDLDFDSSQYVSRQVFYPSKDGTKVPMFVVHKRDLVLDGKAPTFLTAYGCYGQVTPSQFGSLRVPWLERGGVVALANVRGGGAYGKRWHRAGQKENKQNSVDDFIAGALWLQGHGYGSPKTTAINGVSCGGLLIGAALTQRPELFAAATPEVGILDLLRYHEFSGAYLWKDELGSPDVPGERAFLEKLSPVNAAQRRQRYPATLITTRKKDTRVAPMNSYKFAAALREHQSGAAPILLRVDETGGHAPASLPLEERIDYFADLYSFAWDMTTRSRASQ